MSNFIATAASENFPGTQPAFDSVDYSVAPGPIIVDVDTAGSLGWAAGDTYAFIDQFTLTLFADDFTGSGLSETIFGLAGNDTIDGAGGDDVIYGGDDGNTFTGGTGTDLIFGGLGDDIFRVAAGDAVSGEVYDGGIGGTDSIRLVAGGTGSTFDGRGVNIFNIDDITFETAGTLIVDDDASAALIFGTAATGEVVQVESWLAPDTDIATIGASLLTYLNNGIDAVEWSEADDDVRAEFDPDTGTQLYVTYTDTAGQPYTTRSVLYAPDYAVEGTLEVLDSGVVVVTTYDTSGGPGNEVLLTETYEDLSPGGVAEPYDFEFYDYAADGNPDGLLDNVLSLSDTGILTEEAYDAGTLQIRTLTDLSFDGSAAPYETDQFLYDFAGALYQRFQVLDNGVQVISTYDPSGGPDNEVLLTETFEDLSLDGSGAPYETEFYDYAIDGIADGLLDYYASFADTGLLTEQVFATSGQLLIQTITDLSFDGLAAPFQIEQLTYYDSGAPLAYYVLFDPGAPLESLEIIFNEPGTITETIRVYSPSGDITRDFDGSSGDDVIIGDDDDEIYNLAAGADVNDAQGGDDIFRLSPTQADGIWGSGIFTYIELGRLSDSDRISVSLTGKVQVADAMFGGAGSDTVAGSAQSEAVLLYEPNFTPVNSAVDSFIARLTGIEAFEMGDGDDIVNLTSAEDQLGYLTDALIDGGAGNDYLLGGGGNDSIIGGTGLDRIVGWKGNDVLTGGTAPGVGDGVEDRFLFMPGYGGGTTRITDFEDGIDAIWAIGFQETSFASAVTNGVIDITTGVSDTLVTLTGEGQTTKVILEGFTGTLDETDFFIFDTTEVIFSSPPVNLTPISGTTSDDALDGTALSDTFIVGEGVDVLRGLEGNDTFQLTSEIDGTWGAGIFAYAEDVVVSGLGRVSVQLDGKVQVTDTFIGGTGTDSLICTAADEAVLLYEGSFTPANPLLSDQDARLISIEVIDMGDGDDVVNLTSEQTKVGYLTDTLIEGGAGDDYLFAGGGNDSVIGGTGLDRIIGWKGDDVLTGGAAPGVGDGTEDRFLFGAGASGGTDLITDFEDGLDTIWIIGYGVDNLTDAITSGVLDIDVGASNTTLTLTDTDRTNEVVLDGITTALDASDFVFFA